MVEVILVIALLALASSVVSFEIYRHMDRTALRAAGRRLLNTARYGRVLAAEHHKPCRLHLDLDAGTYWLVVQESGIPVGETEGATNTPTGGVRGKKHQLPEKVRFAVVRTATGVARTGGVAEISFHGDGTAEAGLVQLTAADLAQTLLVYPWTGKAELRDEVIDTLPSDTVNLDEGEMARFY